MRSLGPEPVVIVDPDNASSKVGGVADDLSPVDLHESAVYLGTWERGVGVALLVSFSFLDG